MKTQRLIAGLTICISILIGASTSAVASVANPTVTTTAELLAAIKSARPGNTIKLAPGTYANVTIVNANFPATSPLTIMSSSASRAALLVGLRVANSSGLVFNNLELTSVGSPDAYYAFRLASTQNITFTNDNVHGDLNGVPGLQLMGFYLNTCTNTTFTNSIFHHINLPILVTKSTGVTITNSTFAYVNKSGIQFGQASNVDIEGNYFTNFVLTPGTHPDMIQFFTAGTTEPSANITISGNLFNRGRGDAAQGVFIKDETGHMPYHGLVVSNNAIIGGMWNSIYLLNVGSETRVYNNVSASWTGSNIPAQSTSLLSAFTAAPQTDYLGWIMISGDAANQSGVLIGNKAQEFLDANGHQMKPPSGNTQLGPVTDQGAALLRDWQASHRTGSSMQASIVN